MSDTVDMLERLHFFDITDETRRALREVKPIVEPAMPAILDKFYAHFTKWPQLQAMFNSPEHIQSAKRRQGQHWANILTGNFDKAWQEGAENVGRAHFRIGLDPEWYIAGYSAIISGMLKAISDHYVGRFNTRKAAFKRALAQKAILKAAMLDMDIAMSVYKNSDDRATQRRTLDTLASNFEGSVQTVVHAVSAATTELEATARSMSQIAEDTGARASDVAAVAETTQGNVQTVAAATEELTASIGEIGHQLHQSTQSARNAVDLAQNANTQIRDLAEAASKINKVTDLIQDIAEQTNLLALNATIEAARAGDAGRGFAVVAQEVKALASQTAKATDEISQQIGAVQSQTSAAVNAIAAITKAIEEMSSVTSAVSASVEEQNAAAQEISRSVSQTTNGIQQVANNIASVSEAAGQTGAASVEVVSTVSELAKQSDHLQKMVAEFLSGIRAA